VFVKAALLDFCGYSEILLCTIVDLLRVELKNVDLGG